MLPALLIAVGAAWFLLSILAWRNAWHTPRLPQAAEIPLPATVGVSVVIAARNEAARIEQAVRRLLAQKHVDLQLIVVDDRSDDGTGAILDLLAVDDSRLTVLHLDHLPAGWLGKCHACSRGAAQARHDWLLFADGDIHMTDDLVARAIAVAGRDAAEHLTLWPGIECSGPLARAAILAWGQCIGLYAPAAQINRDRGEKGIGVGAFNLVRRAAYLTIGGHEPLRMEVVDDVKLGLLLRRAGFRERLYNAQHDLDAEWANSLRQAIRNLEKNWFAGVEFSLSKSIAVNVTVLGAVILGVIGPWLDPIWGWFAVAGFVSPMALGFWQARLSGWPWWNGVFVPFGFLMFVAAGVHSTFTTLRQGGIRWRDTFYSLAELRAGIVR